LVSKPAVERAFPRQKNPQTLMLQAFHKTHWASAKSSAKSLFPSSSLGGASNKSTEILRISVLFVVSRLDEHGRSGKSVWVDQTDDLSVFKDDGIKKPLLFCK